jgi:hypothetical protein
MVAELLHIIHSILESDQHPHQIGRVRTALPSRATPGATNYLATTKSRTRKLTWALEARETAQCRYRYWESWYGIFTNWYLPTEVRVRGQHKMERGLKPCEAPGQVARDRSQVCSHHHMGSWPTSARPWPRCKVSIVSPCPDRAYLIHCSETRRETHAWVLGHFRISDSMNRGKRDEES